MNIYVQLPFVRGNSQDTISVEQWGVANVQLRNAYLDQWFQDKNRGAGRPAALCGAGGHRARASGAGLDGAAHRDFLLDVPGRAADHAAANAGDSF